MVRRAIYVASSWSNRRHSTVVDTLRRCGHQVYDFKHTTAGTDREFRWEELLVTDPNAVDAHLAPPEPTRAATYLASLTHRAAELGFRRDQEAMLAADTIVLVLPCGRSSHLELGWAVGAGKRSAILLDDPCTPELMYKMVDRIATDLDDLVEWLANPASPQPSTNPRRIASPEEALML
ncbi:uncharacterized protein SHTP_p010 (plasmid) [Mycobacterium ulcerans subsp. shinshuense]|uniref:Nucleoside 2-deoxyribosyltransferase family protein n=1 Tax=Mycobacterium ulcerans subsp. shinshuense TaxID=1124626 RepID=A0A1B4YA15_MYCUL|nr:uncharacterized protein SHTP_p010 [Mycobacterium ulcerans subsp. shinshuense]